MTSPRPVFIIGLPRSGTTVLYRLIQEHPRFRPAIGLELSESMFLDTIASGPRLDVAAMRSFAQLGDDGWAQLVEELALTERRRRWACRVPRRVLQKSPGLWSALGCEAAARHYVVACARSRGVERLVEKTPHHVPWTRHLVRAFPDAQLLAVVRHPLATYASYVRRAREDPNASWAAQSAASFADSWEANACALGDSVKALGERLRVVSYEDLVAASDRFQQALFGWLGETPLDSLPGRVEASPHAPRSEAEQLYGPIRDLGRDWRSFVSADDAAQLERRLEQTMATFGYERMTT